MGATYWTADILTGTADNLYIADRQLSDSEIAALYSGTLPEEGSVNKNKLAALLKTAADTDISDWNDTDKAALTKAAADAITVYDSSSAVQADVDAAAEALENALSEWTQVTVLAGYADTVRCSYKLGESSITLRLTGTSNADIYHADYDESGALTDLNTITFENNSFTVPLNDTGDCVIYIWDNGMKPITMPIASAKN